MYARNVVALAIGAATGIGLEPAQAFARAGGRIVLIIACGACVTPGLRPPWRNYVPSTRADGPWGRLSGPRFRRQPAR